MALILLALLSALPHIQGSIRGLDPAVAIHYNEGSGTFKCLDGSKTVPFLQVNDNYCDCLDGSDEPGTSACYHGKFYCRNKGHEPRNLAAAFVDDGVCDCCDGTDEISGCAYTCLDQSASHKKQLKEEVERLELALKTKAEYISSGKSKIVNIPSKIQEIDAEIVSQQAALSTFQDEVAKLEAEEAELSRRLAEEAAAAAQAQPEEAPLPAEVPVEEMELPLPASEEGNNEVDGVEPEPEDESDEERGRRIASQWTTDPDAATTGGGEEYMPEEEYPVPEEGHVDHEAPAPHRYGNAALEAARTRVNMATSKRDEAIKKRARTTALQTVSDFGPNDMFATYAGSCFEERGTRWTYEACWFGEASQREGWADARTVVGRWLGFDENYTVAVFANGDHCGEAGPRTFHMRLTCGQTEQLYASEEPSTCRYSAYFVTPLVCTPDMLEAAQKQLDAVEAAEQEILAEVEAERQQRQAGKKDEL